MSKYIITATRHYYAGTHNVDRREHQVCAYGQNEADYWKDEWIWESRPAAARALAHLQRGQYVLAHGEHSTPTYRIRRADSRNGRAIMRSSA